MKTIAFLIPVLLLGFLSFAVVGEPPLAEAYRYDDQPRGGQRHGGYGPAPGPWPEQRRGEGWRGNGWNGHDPCYNPPKEKRSGRAAREPEYVKPPDCGRGTRYFRIER